MRKTVLKDGTPVYCLRKSEALVLDAHVEGYLGQGITLGPKQTVLDVGANIGIFGLRLCHRYPDLQVLAFEPIPNIFKVLEANAAFFPNRYRVFNCGLSDQEGTLSFLYFPKSPALSTAYPQDWERDPEAFTKAVAGALRTAPFWYARILPSFLAKYLARYLQSGAQKMVCPLMRLSDFIAQEQLEQIDLLKIDCEGAEWLVLQGIDQEDWPKIRQVVVEVHDWDKRLDKIEQLLREQGFQHITREVEAGFEQTRMCNLFARR